ncbi:MAG: hypothetical protein JWO13_3592 [Acidobacteriales bacterium]|nr:hypothetical protein [Terriglobales bacterium]
MASEPIVAPIANVWPGGASASYGIHHLSTVAIGC